MANGLAVMRDEQTSSLWDHITGECFTGPLTGERLEFWHVSLTTVEAELAQNPEVILLKSDYRGLVKWLMKLTLSRVAGQRGLINRKKSMLGSRFRRSMSRAIDSRRPEEEQGLGVIDAQENGKFYPMDALPKGQVIEDVWHGRTLLIERGAIDGVPSAKWADSDEPPMQLLTRWYGFSFSYPNCDIYEAEQHPVEGR